MFDGTQAIPWGGDKKTMTYASLVMSKQTEILWNMDKLPLMDEAQRKVLLQRIIAESKRRGM
jgi:hypothetical protein